MVPSQRWKTPRLHAPSLGHTNTRTHIHTHTRTHHNWVTSRCLYASTLFSKGDSRSWEMLTEKKNGCGHMLCSKRRRHDMWENCAACLESNRARMERCLSVPAGEALMSCHLTQVSPSPSADTSVCSLLPFSHQLSSSCHFHGETQKEQD